MIGLLAALGLTAAFSAPVNPGSYSEHPPHGEGGLHMVADPRGGAWMWFSGASGEQLRRVGEDGRATAVTLPRKLQGGDLRFVSFADGWALASNKLRISAREHYHCCESLVVAERSPEGRWTRVQAVSTPGSTGEAPEATELAGRIQLGWGEYGEGPEGETVHLAAAPTGRPLRSTQVVRSVLGGRHAGQATTELIAQQGRMHVQSRLGNRMVERDVSAMGHLGRRHMLVSSALQSAFPESLAEPDGSQVWIYDDSDFPDYEQQLLVARRRPGGSRLQRATLVTRFAENGFELAQSADGHVLVTTRHDLRLEPPPNLYEGPTQIVATMLTPRGGPSTTRVAAFDPAILDGAYNETSAINDRGDQLVVTADGNGSSAPLWASVASTSCPAFTPRFELAPDYRTGSTLTAVSGRHGIFHVAWTNANRQVLLSTGRVSCRPSS